MGSLSKSLMSWSWVGVIKGYRYFAGWWTSGTARPSPWMVSICFTRHELLSVWPDNPMELPLVMQTWSSPGTCHGQRCGHEGGRADTLSALYLASHQGGGAFLRVVNIITGYGPTAGAAIAHHKAIIKVAFTSSTKMGHLIQKVAGNSQPQESHLELGGEEPEHRFG